MKHSPAFALSLAALVAAASPPKLAEKRPETGWGEMLQDFFDTTQVHVENHARNGRSTRTFIEEGPWTSLVDSLRAGDYVFVQFGHEGIREAGLPLASSFRTMQPPLTAPAHSAPSSD